MIRRPPRSTQQRSSAASDVYKRQISNGLESEGEYSLAKRIKDDTIKLIDVGGMYEYFNPHTGKGLGGHDFSWTAAILLALGRDSSNLKFTNN